jgi:lysozyme
MSREQLRDQLIRHEGKRQHPYDDATGETLSPGDTLHGNLTIGIGRNLTGVGISDREIEFLFSTDIDRCIRDLATFPWFDSLDDTRQRAIVDMRFNLGPGKFREFTRVMAALGRRDVDAAAQHMLASKWASQVGRRAIRLAKMVQTGQDA